MSIQKKWWVLFVTASSTALIFLDNTIMPVALPTIKEEFNFSSVGLVWVVNAYLLSLTAFLLIGGKLTDLLGKRFLFLWGMLLFGLGSLLGGLSISRWLVILSRVLQGMGGALTIPTTSALLISHFPEGEKAKAIGINSGISAIFLILGPVVGAFLTVYLSWRAIFFINIPIVIFGMLMAVKLLEKEERRREHLHYAGAFALLVAIVVLVVGLMQANEWGWGSSKTISLFLVTPLFFGLFIWLSLRHPDPIIDFNFFRNPLFTAANLSLFISQLVVMVTVLWAIYFQQHLSYTVVQTGLLIFVATVPVVIMAPLAGHLSDKYGPRFPMLLGYFILAFSLFWLLFAVQVEHFYAWLLLPGLVGFGLGLPLILSPTIALGLSVVDPQKLGSASGITTETRQLASTLGIAIMTALYQGIEKLTGSHVEAFIAISILAGILSMAGLVMTFLMVKKEAYSA